MTELEKKLKKLGYNQAYIDIPCSRYKNVSSYNSRILSYIDLNESQNKIDGYYVDICDGITSQQDIDYIQIAFNNLERDIKELGGEINK